MLKPFIKHAVELTHLDAERAEEAMGIVMRGAATPAQIAAWLVALRLKGETAGEIIGFARGMRGAMVTLDDVPDDAIDTCGTGGDGLSTFNISTAAALIVAACGVPVAKHGNKAVSSQCGSADVLAALGFDIDPGAETASRALRQTNFAFLFAPGFHPAMKHAIGPRWEIGIRTVFNILGPLCNPARVRRQVVGVYDRCWLEPVAAALGALGAERALVVSGPGGADEILPCGENFFAEWDCGQVRAFSMDCADFGLSPVSIDELRGDSAERNARMIQQIAAGAAGPKTEVALLNAGAALWVAGKAPSIHEGMEMARQAIKDGRVSRLIDKAASASRSKSPYGSSG
jgi:anthranilate phosphoribosyltransferase